MRSGNDWGGSALQSLDRRVYADARAAREYDFHWVLFLRVGLFGFRQTASSSLQSAQIAGRGSDGGDGGEFSPRRNVRPWRHDAGRHGDKLHFLGDGGLSPPHL